VRSWKTNGRLISRCRLLTSGAIAETRAMCQARLRPIFDTSFEVADLKTLGHSPVVIAGVMREPE